VVVGVVSGAPGAGGGVNGVQDVEANLRAWTACSIASSSGREERLETTMGGSVLRLVMALLKTDAIDCQFTSGKCARAWARYGDRKEAAGSPGGVGFGLKCPQVPAAPARDLRSLAASRTMGGEGKGRGGRGLLIGVARGRNGQGINSN
jgi:hypothetical protein